MPDSADSTTLPKASARRDAAGADWLAPGRIVATLIVFNALFWIAIPSLLHQAPPRDVIEGYMWGREWVIATYKHPALPSWLIEASRVATGGHYDWPVYIVAQLVTAGCLWLVYETGKAIFGPATGPQIGACGALALLPIEHFSWMSPVFNHNLPQMFGWVAVVYFAWRAVEENRTLLWVLLGWAAAIALYGKLSSAFLAVAVGVWFLMDATARRRLLSTGPWLAAGVLACLLVPLIVWLVRNNFQPLTYAQSRTGELDTMVASKFAVTVLLIQLPVLAVLALARLLPGQPERPPITPTTGPDVAEAATRHARGVRYLMVMTLVPVLVPVVLGVIRDSGLRASWLSPAMNTASLLLVALATAFVTPAMVKRLATVTAAVAVATAALYAATLVIPFRSGNPARVMWPQAEIATRMGAIWHRETSAPLKVVAGDMWVAGLVGYRAPTNPSLLTDGDFTLSPWVTPERIKREGAFILWHDRGDALNEPLTKLIERRPVRSEEFRASRGTKTRPITIRYVIIPPEKSS
jgi:hypothetical protein